MHILYETEDFAFYHDDLYGVGNFERMSDNHVSLLETGRDCVVLIANLNDLWAKCERGEIDEVKRDGVFDMIASEYM